jgi:hypothetical protein
MSNTRPVVMVFGRFNPPTIGHEALIQYVQSIAHRVGGDVRVYPSQSQDPRKNPLPFRNKVRFLRAFFPSVTISDNPNIRTPIDAFAEVSALGYTDVILVSGSDRVSNFEKLGVYLVPRSSPKYDATKHIPIDHYRVVGVPGERDPDAEGVAGMSASKMRKLAADNDMASFMQGIPRHVSQIVAKDLFKQVRQYMGLHERFNITQGQFAVGLFEAHDILKPGTTVRVSYKGHRATGKIVRYDKGDGPHGTPYYIVDVGGQHSDPHAMHRSEKFPVHAVVKEDHVKVGDKVHAGLGTRGGAGFSGVVDRIEGNYVYVNIGKDKFGDRIIKAPHSHVMKEAVGRVHGLTAQDQLRGARIIYRALTNTEAPRGMVNPIDLINTAIPEMLKKKHTPEGWHIAGQMLTKAREQLGIDWDLNKINPAVRRAMRIQESETQVDEAHDTQTEATFYGRGGAFTKATQKALSKWGKEHKEDFDATAIEHNKVVDQIHSVSKDEFQDVVVMFRKKHPHATISFMNKSGTVVKVVKSGENLKEAETPTATKPPSETERLRTTQQQELIALKTRQANAMMAAKLRDVQMKAREAQAKANQPKPAAKPAS